MSCQLLPPNRSALEAALADACQIDLETANLRGLADSSRCPDALLPWLAWAWSVENLDAASTVEKQRALIRSSLDVHRHKGTVAAVRQVFRDLGYGEVVIDEGNQIFTYNGRATYDGFASYGDQLSGWAEYRVQIDKLLNIEQAQRARDILADVAPARCVLWGLDFTGAALLYNDIAAYDGNYTYGVA
ncbi:phage tail protein I [Chromobacterium amazonense]|uniref:Phage tail protein I n=1 Tax=Chromobacterium amazonense TaxID=1382803 RepID=A0ABU8V2N1_9NEIS|nr:phage tail protein I [Chromobacterium amazonense]MDQ4540737.1 phage tail protein I [Chromobacterium amazonense]